MAESSVDETLGGNIPRYEPNDLNSQIIHIGSFRNLWLEALPSDVYSFEAKPEEIENAELEEILEIPTETLNELKEICRFVTPSKVFFLILSFNINMFTDTSFTFFVNPVWIP